MKKLFSVDAHTIFLCLIKYPGNGADAGHLNLVYNMLRIVVAHTNMLEDIFCSSPELYDAGKLQTGNLHPHLHEHF
jgi:hypothetical protein